MIVNLYLILLATVTLAVSYVIRQTRRLYQ